MKKYGKYTLLGWSWRILLGIVLTPILLFLLLAVLIYVPPVQKFAVDKTAEILSEELNIDVTVESVHLAFPLDLTMDGILAVQDGDTVLAARQLDISIKALPLFQLQAEVDGIHLYDAKLNTKDLIDACVVKGHVAELSLASHSTDLQNELAVVNKALLKEADLMVLLNDSVPEDTTESEPLAWKIQLDDVEFQQVRATVLLTPQSDSTFVTANIASAHANGYLDLGKEIYQVHHLGITQSEAGFEYRNEPHFPHQLDPNHLYFTDMNLAVDSFEYRGTGDMTLLLTQLSGIEQSGLVIAETRGRVEMDSLSLTVPQLHVRTADSDLALTYRMDLNAFDDINPGTFALTGKGQMGKDDILYFTKMGGEEDTRDVRSLMSKELPARPVEVQLKASGNLQTLEASELHVKVPTKCLLDGTATLWDVADDLSLRTQLKMKDGRGSLDLKANYVMNTDAYKAELAFNNFVLNNYVPFDEPTVLTGRVSAHGHGFDFFSPRTLLDAQAHLTDAHMGKMNLGGMNADASLKSGALNLTLACDNNQLQTNFIFDGEMKNKHIQGTLNIDLPFADVQAMGFSDEPLTATTNGTLDFSYNFDHLFRIDSYINTLGLKVGSDSISTQVFNLYAEAMPDSTAATLHTGDMFVSLFAPHNLFKLLPKVERLQRETVRQFKQHNVNLDELKAFLPHLSLSIAARDENPFSDILEANDISFSELAAVITSSPTEGLIGKGHVYAFKKDSVRVDTAFFDIVQDTTQLDYHIGVQCSDQPLLPAFRAYLDGYLMADRADAHLTYFDKKNRKGIDLGVKALANDTCVNYTLYPQKPIIAYREFSINDDNYITTFPNRPTLSDIRLSSLSDSTYFAVFADEDGEGRQIANVIANDLNLREILAVVPIPGLPDLGGMLHLDATYIDQGENFMVEGQMDADRFSYEGMTVGNLQSRFTYMPQGENLHVIDADLAYNDTRILQLDGTYNAEAEGALDASLSFLDLPMSMLSAFVPNQVARFDGHLAGDLKVTGPMDALLFNGYLMPDDVHLLSNTYSVDLSLANDTLAFNNSRIDFDSFKFYSVNDNPLTLNGYVDFANLDEVFMSLSLNGRNFKLIEAPYDSKKLLYGNLYGDFFARVIGSTKDLTVRGLVRVLPTTNLTYIMSETALYQTDRLEDIVTFVDFSVPPPPKESLPERTYMGIDMNVVLSVEDGAKLRGEFSADKQSYVNVQGGGNITMSYTPEGVFNLQGRYTINEGEMKYTLPVIPLKTFKIHPGSYVEFMGAPGNPVLNITATERIRAAVGQGDGSSRNVPFDVGLKISNTLENLGLEFIIDAPDDINVQSELANSSAEDRNKLAVGMLATGMYLSGSNSKGFVAGNALNGFLEEEINKIAGNALSTMVNVSVGLDQTIRDDGSKRTDYSFKFSRKFFSDRLNVVIGGKVSSDNNNQVHNESGAYIDDVSLEWRLDNGGTQYVRLFHEKDFSNLLEGEIDKSGVGVLLRKKVDRFSELLIWKKKETDLPERRAGNTGAPSGNVQSSSNNAAIEKKEE